MNQLTYAEPGKKVPFWGCSKLNICCSKEGMICAQNANILRRFPQAESGTTNILVWLYFFQWAAGKNPTQSYCQCTVRLVPSVKSG
jgi:hypothetical protein